MIRICLAPILSEPTPAKNLFSSEPAPTSNSNPSYPISKASPPPLEWPRQMQISPSASKERQGFLRASQHSKTQGSRTYVNCYIPPHLPQRRGVCAPPFASCKPKFGIIQIPSAIRQTGRACHRTLSIHQCPCNIIQPYWRLPSVYGCRRAKVRPLVADSQSKRNLTISA